MVTGANTSRGENESTRYIGTALTGCSGNKDRYCAFTRLGFVSCCHSTAAGSFSVHILTLIPVNNSCVPLSHCRPIPLDQGQARVRRHMHTIRLDIAPTNPQHLPRRHITKQPLNSRDKVRPARSLALAEIHSRVRRVGANHQARVRSPLRLPLPQEGAAAIILPIRAECFRSAVR